MTLELPLQIQMETNDFERPRGVDGIDRCGEARHWTRL
jgi:hypothetical protein